VATTISSTDPHSLHRRHDYDDPSSELDKCVNSDASEVTQDEANANGPDEEGICGGLLNGEASILQSVLPSTFDWSPAARDSVGAEFPMTANPIPAEHAAPAPILAALARKIDARRSESPTEDQGLAVAGLGTGVAESGVAPPVPFEPGGIVSPETMPAARVAASLGPAGRETDEAERALGNVISTGEETGLPVRYLWWVQDHVPVETGPEGSASQFQVGIVYNRIRLSPQDVGNSAAWSAKSQVSLAHQSAATVYHEAAHAFMWTCAKNAPENSDYGSFYRDGVRYYQNAPLRTADGKSAGVTGDPQDVFMEAVGNYVDHRVLAYSHARGQLLWYQEHGGITPERFAEVEQQYNQKMAQRSFGYDNLNPIQELYYGESELATTRPLSEPLRKFIDERMLEGKIPDQFRDSALYRDFCPTSTNAPSQ
jgi:hypothetical protein